MERSRAMVWAIRALWASLPFTVGPVLADAFSTASRPVQVVAAIGLWGGWAAGLAAALVPTTVSLTVLRLLAPVPVVAAIWATFAAPQGAQSIVAVTVAALLALGAFRGEVGRVFAQGSAYGDEARFPLRPPGPLVAGPLPLLWAVLAAATVAGPLLLAARSWVLGASLSVAACGLLLVLPRRFHRLSRRFLVFVPAGLAVHDHVVLVETAMFRWSAIRAVDQALSGTDALDLTARALGSALEVRLVADDAVIVVGRGPRQASTVRTSAFLCSPTLLAGALREASLRRGA